MRKNRPINVVVHRTNIGEDLGGKINRFYVDIVERRIRQSGLSLDEKKAVLDGLIKART